MSSISNTTSLGGDILLLGQGSDKTTGFDIITNNGRSILINGVDPTSGGGSGGGPYDGPGNIRLNTGNLTAVGDGISNGKIEGQTIKSIDNIVITSGSLEVTTGGVDIKANGNMTLEGNGNINQLGTGKISSGSGGIESLGDIKTIGAFDLEIGQNIYFDGDDIFHRTNNPSAQKSYKDYKQLVGLNDANVFTGANQFNDNTTEFAAKVSVGTRDPVSELFTQNLALNSSGNIESKTINNTTIVQCGNVNCGNAGLNEVRARQFKTRTNENNSPEGWTISQQTPSNPAVTFDRALAFTGGEANAFISILDNAHGIIPNIVLDPRTSALGGLIVANTYQVGPSAEGFKIEQPNSGTEIDNLLVKAGQNEGQVKFQNNAGTIDLAIIQKDSVTNQGRLYCPAIFFGTTGIHNSIVNDTSGADSLVLKIKQATASSKVEFLDNAAASIMEVKKTEIELGTTIPINFGAYSFLPVQFYKDITAFSFNNSALGSTNLIFKTNDSDWINKNTGATGQNLGMSIAANRGAYKLGFAQIGAGALGQINDLRFISDTVLTQANDNLPNVILPSASAYSFEAYDGTSAPVVTMAPGFLHYSVFAQFPGVSGSETSNVRITLTKMPYFA